MEILETMGEQIKMARLRRDISAELVAKRANISRATLWNIEKGSPSVAIGNYAAVLHALNNMDRDLLKVAKDDEFGRKLQDLNISTKKGLQTRKNKLWKRIVFNMAVNNTDDHLRNHGFILTKSGWGLSPLYDVNPVPFGDELSLNVDANDNRVSADLAIKSASYYNLK